MRVKIDEVLAHVQRSINNLSRLFSTRNERGACVLDPELAGTVCTGLLTNLGVLQRQVDDVVDSYEKVVVDLEALVKKQADERDAEIAALRQQLEAAQQGSEVAGLRTHIEYLEALLDLIRKDQKRPKKDRKTVSQLERVLVDKHGIAVPDDSEDL